MQNKGFTLIEMLTVIIILGLLVLIAVPTTVKINNNIKQKLLEEKIVLSEKNAVLWAQDNKKCFTINDCSGITDAGFSCVDNSNSKTCTINLSYLANEDYIEYDEEDLIINPHETNKCLNNYKINVKYTKKNKTFSATINRSGQNTNCPS